MNNVVDIYKRQRLEFIQIHGYEYYNSIYGYEPVYHRRSMICKQIPKTTENFYESDNNSQMSDRYVEYYTDDDDDDWDADSMKEYDTIDDGEDEYND